RARSFSLPCAQGRVEVGLPPRGATCMSARRAAWLFLTPALLVLGVFFLIPVLGALVLSFTDYDLYALADLHNLRFVALGNYWVLLHRPAFWVALGHTFYF